MKVKQLKERIRVIMDYPQEGIRFKDITTLLKDPEAFKSSILQLADFYRDEDIDVIVGPEARGFLIGAPLAYELGVGFVPVRKEGKLPAEVESFEYDLEYGTDCLEVHKDGIEAGDKVLIVDDLLATGGTVAATIKLVEKLGGEVVGVSFLIELSYLDGRKNLDNYNVTSLIQF